MSHSRAAILESIRSKGLTPTELPSLDQNWIRYEDPVAQYATVLAGVGGQCIRVPKLEDVDSHLQGLNQFASAKVRCSLVAGCGQPTLDAQSVNGPHDLEQVDFAVLPGQLAIAENGAVWITDELLRFRVLYFLCQHLALVVPTRDVVHNMHEAYARIKVGERQFGAFISGPSKTADIEQSLVVGAHGPRSHLVFLVDELGG